MTDDLCYTRSIQDKKTPTGESKHDERIVALVRFIARCAASDDYHKLHNLIEEDLKDKREQ